MRKPAAVARRMQFGEGYNLQKCPLCGKVVTYSNGKLVLHGNFRPSRSEEQVATPCINYGALYAYWDEQADRLVVVAG